MGVTIHYRGQLADIGKIKILCDELTQIAGMVNNPMSGSVIPSDHPGCRRMFLKNMVLQRKIQRTEIENGGSDQCPMMMTW